MTQNKADVKRLAELNALFLTEVFGICTIGYVFSALS